MARDENANQAVCQRGGGLAPKQGHGQPVHPRLAGAGGHLLHVHLQGLQQQHDGQRVSQHGLHETAHRILAGAGGRGSVSIGRVLAFITTGVLVAATMAAGGHAETGQRGGKGDVGEQQEGSTSGKRGVRQRQHKGKITATQGIVICTHKTPQRMGGKEDEHCVR